MVPQVVIAGGGVIGAATAYYLSQRGIHPVVIEACTPACSASGKAGGFLALDWCDSSALGPLARKSFALHAELAATLGDECGYRRVNTHSVAIRNDANSRSIGKSKDLPRWVNSKNVLQTSIIGSEENTAQVHPKRLTEAMLAAVARRGGQVIERTEVIRILLNKDGGNRVTGVTVRNVQSREETTLDATVIVLALGVWTSCALKTILPEAQPLPKISGLKVHSVVLDDTAGAGAEALFVAYRGPDRGLLLEPEVYPRPDNSVYVCGVSSEEAPPQYADAIEPEGAAIALLQEVAGVVSKPLASARLLKSQACFLPCSDDGLPLIGPIPGVEGAYIGGGHSCWGVLNAPATGLSLAELIVDGRSSIDLSAFNPGR